MSRATTSATSYIPSQTSEVEFFFFGRLSFDFEAVVAVQCRRKDSGLRGCVRGCVQNGFRCTCRLFNCKTWKVLRI